MLSKVSTVPSAWSYAVAKVAAYWQAANYGKRMASTPASKVASVLHWQARTKLPDVAKLLVDDCVKALEQSDTVQ